MSEPRIDPDIRPLPGTDRVQPGRALGRFRELLADTSWADQTPNTLFAPVYTDAESAGRFAEAVRQLYLAHLAVLRCLLASGPFGPAGERYAELAEPVRRFYLDWPVLTDDLAPAELTAPDRLARLFGRPDVVLAVDGPKTVETNFDTAVAGQERPDDMWAMAAAIFSPGPQYTKTGRPLQGMSDYFVEHADGRPAEYHWIMKDDPVARREMAPLIDYLNRSQQLVRHTLHYPGDDLSRLRPSDGRHYLHRSVSIFTVNKDRQRFAELLAALRAVAPTCTVPIGLSAVASKLFLAWLSDPAARPAQLTVPQLAAVGALVPWTRVLGLLDRPGLAPVLAEPAEYVLKKADSYQATEVHFGWQVPADEWPSLVEHCLADPLPWIVQRRVRPKLCQLAEYTDDGLVVRETGLSCCPYLMGGRFRGLETWITPAEPDLTMINRMQFVPHFIRA
jgi:hypothetical protein